MSLLSNTLSLFPPKPSLFLSLNGVRAQRRSNIYQFYSQVWFKPTSSRTHDLSHSPRPPLHHRCGFLVRFVLLNLQFSVWCFVDRLSVHLSFCPFSFGHCVIRSFFFWSLCYLVLLLLAIVLSGPSSFGHCVIWSFFFWSLCCLTFFIWPLCCLSFDLRMLITPLISSNSSQSSAHR